MSSPVKISKDQLHAMALRLVLARLEPDKEQRVWFRELVRQQSGLTEEQFRLCDELVEVYVMPYEKHERAGVAECLTNILQRMLRNGRLDS